jgi:hypothetical protein
MRSTVFYEQFGFDVRNTYAEAGRQIWCWLERNQARLMLAEADAPVVASEQAVLFYVYVHKLEELHSRLTEAGLEPGIIESGAPGPDRQFRIFDLGRDSGGRPKLRASTDVMKTVPRYGRLVPSITAR